MKFLVLHGYGQNGVGFQRKHRGVERHLRQTFHHATFVYPTAPVQLRSDDRPEDVIDTHALPSTAAEDLVQRCVEPRGWCHLYTARETPFGLNESLDLIAETLTSQGPFDGIIAFSQGTYIAAMVLSLLEGTSRYQAYEQAKQADPTVFAYPQSFRHINHPPLKFGVLYSGFMAQQPQFAWLYDLPRIQTPILHYVGEYDPVLEDQWREAMHARVCNEQGPDVVIHPGAHHVPTSVKHLQPMTTFIQTSVANYVYIAPEAVEEVEEVKDDEDCDARNDSAVEPDAYDHSRLCSTLRSRRRSIVTRRQRPREQYERGHCRRTSAQFSSSSPRCCEPALTATTPIWSEKTLVAKKLRTVKLSLEVEITCPPLALLKQMSYLPSSGGMAFAEVVY